MYLECLSCFSFSKHRLCNYIQSESHSSSDQCCYNSWIWTTSFSNSDGFSTTMTSLEIGPEVHRPAEEFENVFLAASRHADAQWFSGTTHSHRRSPSRWTGETSCLCRESLSWSTKHKAIYFYMLCIVTVKHKFIFSPQRLSSSTNTALLWLAAAQNWNLIRWAVKHLNEKWVYNILCLAGHQVQRCSFSNSRKFRQGYTLIPLFLCWTT